MSIFSTAFGAVTGNPLSYLKIGGYVVAGAAVLFLGYRVEAFYEQARADHAAVAVVTVQRDAAIKQADANALAAAQDAARHEATVASANAAAAEATTRAQKLALDLDTLRHGKPSTGCVPSAAAHGLLDRLR